MMKFLYLFHKIQTTSPEKFRVRPRLGILNPGESIVVNIFLKPEHNLSENGKDKFLIMCLPAVDVQTNQNADFWKKLDNNAANVEQHRLCCVYKDSEIGGNTGMISNGYSASSGDKKLESSTKVKCLMLIVFFFIRFKRFVFLKCVYMSNFLFRCAGYMFRVLQL